MENKDWKDYLGDVFDGLADTLDRAGKPIFSAIAVIVPYISPYIIGNITAGILVSAGILNANQAWLLVVVLEGIGVVGLSGLVLAIIQWAKSRNEKAKSLIILLGSIDVVYFALLVAINVALEWGKVSNTELFIKALICFIPLLSGGIYGYYRVVNENRVEAVDAKREAKEKEEREFQWKKEKWYAKQGKSLPVAEMTTYPKDVPQEKIKKASDYKEQIWKYLDDQLAKGRVPGVKDITERFHLPYDKAKGFCSTQRTLWAEQRGVDLKNSGSTS